jgi:SAM-dependent methyltransferase
MAELEYYENEYYQDFLLSSHRREIYPAEVIFENFSFKGVENLVDFGAGKGFFLTEFPKVLSKTAWVWAAECQQDVIDIILKRKIEENIQNMTPFYIERSDHPLLPEWIPQPDLIFSSLCLSTFPDPGLAMDGLIRSMRPGGRLIVVDWNKLDFDIGPRVSDKISVDKMIFLAEDYKLKVIKQIRIREYFYAFEVVAGKDFVWGYYDLKEEEEDGGIWGKS